MSLGKVRQLRESDGSGDIEHHRPCTVCNRPTLSATLSQYGARCFPCYERYLTEAPQTETANKRVDGPKAWAHHLRASEQAGARLTPAQREMWRSALVYESRREEQE